MTQEHSISDCPFQPELRTMAENIGEIISTCAVHTEILGRMDEHGAQTNGEIAAIRRDFESREPAVVTRIKLAEQAAVVNTLRVVVFIATGAGSLGVAIMTMIDFVGK